MLKTFVLNRTKKIIDSLMTLQIGRHFCLKWAKFCSYAASYIEKKNQCYATHEEFLVTELSKMGGIYIKKDIRSDFKVTVIPPVVINKSLFFEQDDIPVLDRFVVKFDRTIVMGATDFLFKEGKVHAHSLETMILGRHSLKLPKTLVKYFDGESISLMFDDIEPVKIERGIHFLFNYSYNYFHWMFECLPRLVLLESDKKFEDYPLLVDEGLPLQFLEALSTITKGRYKLVFLKKLIRYEVRELIYPSFLSVCNDTQPFIKPTPAYFLVSPLVIDFLKKHLNAPPNTCGKRNLFISRQKIHCDARPLRNSDKVVEKLSSAGFETVYPEKMSFHQQIEIFSQAKCIVCTAGSALSNMLFCQPGTKILAILPGIKNPNFYIFSQIAHYCQIDLRYFVGEAEDPFVIHSGFVVDVEGIAEWIALQ